MAAEHTISALKKQIQSPVSLFFFSEDEYAAVNLSAIIALAQGQAVKAARLLGSTDQFYQYYRPALPLFSRQLFDQTIEEAQTALGEETFTTAWEEGKAMDLKEALAYALEVVEEIQLSSHQDSEVGNDSEKGFPFV